MSGIIPIFICFVAMLIQALMQLAPGTFAILYHYQSGKKSTKKADDLGLFFILGVELFVGLVAVLVYAAMYAIFCTVIEFNDNVLMWALAGVCFAEGMIVALCYYRRSKATALFIPRTVAREIRRRAERAERRSDAMLLGMFVGVPELIFTLPLYIIMSIQMMQFVTIPPFLIIILYILMAMLPPFAIRFFYRGGYNLAEIERLRVKTKPYIRIALAVGFVMVGCAVMNLAMIDKM